MINKIRKYFITGIVVLVPIWLTFYVLISIFNFLDGILGKYLSMNYYYYVPGIGFFIFIVFILLFGFLANKFLVGKKIFMQFEKWFSALPIIKSIYPTLKYIFNFVSEQKEFGFKKVVLVEYPSKGIWSIGFLTNEEFTVVNKTLNLEMVSVFIPSVPNPLTGFVILVSKNEVKLLDIPVSEALKIIVSGGVVKS